MEHRKSETESHCFTQLQANQKSQQDEIENRLKEIQHEVNTVTHLLNFFTVKYLQATISHLL